MRLLLDKNLSFQLCAVLHDRGHDAVHVDDLGLSDADDVVILSHAREQDRIVESSDTDFGGLLAAQRAGSPSVVLTREIATLHTSELGPLLVAALEVAAKPLRDGAVAAVGTRCSCPPTLAALTGCGAGRARHREAESTAGGVPAIYTRFTQCQGGRRREVPLFSLLCRLEAMGEKRHE